jgi:Beta-propeller repeat
MVHRCLVSRQDLDRPFWNLTSALLTAVFLLLPVSGRADTPSGTDATVKRLPGSAKPAPARRPLMPRMAPHTPPEMPLLFVANSAQAHQAGVIASDDAILYSARTANMEVLLRRSGFIIRTVTAVPSAPAAVDKTKAATGLPNKEKQGLRVDEQSIEFQGADHDVVLEPLEPQDAQVNFFEGSDPAKWKRNLTAYGRVRYHNLYPGIDLIFYANHGKLETDWYVSPGADTKQIRMSAPGAMLEADGNLLLKADSSSTPGANAQAKSPGFEFEAPVAYQAIPEGKHFLASKFVINAEKEIALAVANYDHAKPLVIDPTLSLLFSTYFGGLHNDVTYALTLDAAGNIYMAGRTASEDFPVSGSALQPVRQNIGTYTYDGFIAKFSPAGTLLYSTFLGGSSDDSINGVALDASGNAFVVGTTSSVDFPVTTGAMQGAYQGGGSDGFIAQISPDGSQLLYSTYFGTPGSDAVNVIKADAAGYIIGGSSGAAGLPTTSGSYQPANAGQANAFFGRFTFSSGTLAINALTYLGGNAQVNGPSVNSVDVDSSGNVYFTGEVFDPSYTVTSNALIPTFSFSGACAVSSTPESAGFVTKFSPDFSKLLYSTYLGGHTEATANAHEEVGCAQRGIYLHVNADSSILIIGNTSESDFPITSNAIRSQLNGDGGAGFDDFVTIISADGSKFVYSTFLGGTDFEYSDSAAVDSQGNIWIFGATDSTDFPTTSDALQPASGGAADGSLTELSPDGTQILYSTYYGGNGNDNQNGGHIVIDAANNVYLASDTSSTNFGVTTNAFQSTYADSDQGPDGSDAYLSILGSGIISMISPLTGGNAGDVSISFSGAGFESGATCTLVSGGTTITATQVTITNNGTSMTCTFALNGAAVGSYDVVVNNPDGTSISKSQAFNVQNGVGSNVWVDVSGRSTIRIGVPDTFVVTYGNTGDTDAYLVPIWIEVPGTVTLSYTNYNPPEPSNGVSIDYSQIPQTYQINGNTVAELMVPRIPAGGTYSLPLQITSGGDLDSFDITVYTSAAPYAQSASDIASQTTNMSEQADRLAIEAMRSQLGLRPHATTAGQCLNDIMSTLLSAIPGLGAAGCVGGVVNGLSGVITQSFDNAADGNYSAPVNWTALGQNFIASAGAPCLQAAVGSIPFLNLAAALYNAYQAYQDCQQYLKPLLPKPMKPVKPKKSKDPNEKSGPEGTGDPSYFIKGSTPLSYNVAFENDPTAQLPAANVYVTDQLDPSKVDLSTLTLGSIQIAGKVITLPANTNNYNTTYSLNSSLGVRVQGSLNPSTGLLKWTFITIDPTTNQPPSDPTLGFLPPDTDGIQGQGSMVFTVMPKAGISTGAQITNLANVIFDANQPIVTPTWLNTIDVDPPVSAVAALPSSQAATDVAVSWTGTDNGSGIATYNVYVSDNGSAFFLWQSDVTATSATYSGVAGHTYGFLSIATDAVGNVEKAKTSADTSILVGVTPDFSVTSGEASLSVPRGSTGSTTLTITPAGGFNSAVSFSCSGLPSEAACSFSPSTATPAGGAVTTTLTISTTAPKSSLSRAGWPALGGVAVALFLFWRRRQFRAVVMAGVVLMAMAGFGIAGCGGSSNTPTGPSDPGTPTGTSTVTVTATAGTGASAITHTLTVSLTVQ